MSKIKNLKELREFILYLEDKYDLLNFEIDGVKPWQLKRVTIDYNLGKIAGLMEAPHLSLNFKTKILNSLNILKSSIFHNPFFAHKKDIIVFPHSRVKKVEGKYIDIYTHYFVKELKKEESSLIEIENPYIGKHYTCAAPYRYHNDFILVLKKLISKFIKIGNIDYNYISKVEQEIESRIGKFKLKDLFENTVKQYKIEYQLYKKLLEKIQPRQIYLVVSYSGFGSLIKAAKDLDIEIIELQHGNFSKYHFGYYFGENKKKLDYFPDKFYVWNEYWKNRMNFPIEDSGIVIKQFDYLEYRKSLYNHIQKNKNQVIVLSQGVLGDMIAKKIYDNWEYFKQFDIKYKLHPGEYDRHKEYKYLQKISEYKNVEILTDIDLYEYFASSEFQIGVYSTALYEGVEFECKTILLNLGGIEEMYYFNEKYKAIVI